MFLFSRAPPIANKYIRAFSFLKMSTFSFSKDVVWPSCVVLLHVNTSHVVFILLPGIDSHICSVSFKCPLEMEYSLSAPLWITAQLSLELI